MADPASPDDRTPQSDHARATPAYDMGYLAYHDKRFSGPPRSGWHKSKRETSGMNVSRRLWDQRQGLRRDYEAVHGTDPTQWPVRHPGVVLDAVQWIAHSACLGCEWMDRQGVYMKESGWRERALAAAREHEESWHR
ncbi:hypothetical protein AAFP30_05820 [Gordonia sp. CPCC 205515]|uniref:hypothetical protein n=1 Tax=Gordonia sp. CPCC 205515 TaxID=3140791 RepID=UPI003AF38CB1